MNTHQRVVAVAVVTAAALLLAACPPRVSIADINRDPGRYLNRDISVAGRVSNSFGAMGTGVYELSDGSGSIWVYSQNFGVPSTGTKVAVTGRISQGFNFGGRSFAVVLRETERRH
ncbi:MAG TPA: OB-fold nucleic acid binding domain-containing protein [Terriglobales bacterium]|nr:OB-fold nucleic acid binding domain-containing protein [Terriglobales bacterium]